MTVKQSTQSPEHVLIELETLENWHDSMMLRERSLFTGGGGVGGNPKILRTQNLPRSLTSVIMREDTYF